MSTTPDSDVNAGAAEVVDLPADEWGDVDLGHGAEERSATAAASPAGSHVGRPSSTALALLRTSASGSSLSSSATSIGAPARKSALYQHQPSGPLEPDPLLRTPVLRR